jgi:hypothetical protein
VARLPESAYQELDAALRDLDAARRADYPGDAAGRQPVHTVYVPADRLTATLTEEWGAAALAALAEHGPLPFPPSIMDRVEAKLRAEPIEDLRVDFEDGYGVRHDTIEDAAAFSAGALLRHNFGEGGASRPAGANNNADAGPMDVVGSAQPRRPEGVPVLATRPPFFGLRAKSLEAATGRRAARTLDLFLETLGVPPDGFVITLPKVTSPEQVAMMVRLCAGLEEAHGLPEGHLRFEVQIETPQAIVGPDGTATVARLIRAAEGRCTGLHYGTYDYSASVGVAAAYQSLEHPAADHAKAVMQVAAAGTGVRLSDGSTNVLPVGSHDAVRDAWDLHARLVRRCLERGFYQGWDLHPAQLPTRYAATYAFFRDGLAVAVDRLGAYLDRRSAGILDEPATARALAGFLLRGLDCGAVTAGEVGFARATLEGL